MPCSWLLFAAHGYNRYSGIRKDYSWTGILKDSIEEMGIGMLLSFFILLILNRIQIGMPIAEITGKVTVEAMIVSIGVSVGTTQLSSSGGGMSGEKKKDKRRDNKLALAATALSGGNPIGGNVAPTQEIIVIAIESKPVHLLIMFILSLSCFRPLLCFSVASKALKIFAA